MTNNKSSQMTTYLTNLITEKGVSVDVDIKKEGHIGLTWRHLIEFIEVMPEQHEQIRTTLVKIDFMNGDVFHYLNFLIDAMINAKGLSYFSM